MKIAVMVSLLFLAAAVAWFAGEQRYDNCIQKARAEYPLGKSGLTAKDRAAAATDLEHFGEEGFSPPDDEVEDRPRRRRKAALNDCSRLPW